MIRETERDNIVRAIEVLKEVIDKRYEDDSFKSIILKTLKSFVKSKIHKIIILLTTLSISAYSLLRFNQVILSNYFARLSLFFLFCYIVLVFMIDPIRLFRKENRGSLPSYSQRLIDSIRGIRRTSLEEAYEPFIDSAKIDEIINELIIFDVKTLKHLEQILTRDNNFSKKNNEYMNKIFPLLFPIFIISIYGSGLWQTILVGFIGFFLYYLQLVLEKSSMNSKINLCIYLINQVQILKSN